MSDQLPSLNETPDAPDASVGLDWTIAAMASVGWAAEEITRHGQQPCVLAACSYLAALPVMIQDQGLAAAISLTDHRLTIHDKNKSTLSLYSDPSIDSLEYIDTAGDLMITGALVGDSALDQDMIVLDTVIEPDGHPFKMGKAAAEASMADFYGKFLVIAAEHYMLADENARCNPLIQVVRTMVGQFTEAGFAALDPTYSQESGQVVVTFKSRHYPVTITLTVYLNAIADHLAYQIRLINNTFNKQDES